MKSHLISQVVLRAFGNEEQQVEVHDAKSGQSSLAATADIAFREMDKDIIGELEQQWSQEVENDAVQSIRILRNGDLLYQEKHIRIIKKLLVLHYMRTQVYLIAEKPDISEAHRTWVIDQVAERYPERRALIESTVSQQWPDKLNEVAVMSMKEYIPKIEAFVEELGLEIGEAPDGAEFILGDVPVITADGSGKYGAINGVPVTEAVGFAMPLTPRHVVSLKKNPVTKKYIKLTAEQVKNVNNKQRDLVSKVYYTKPKSV